MSASRYGVPPVPSPPAARRNDPDRIWKSPAANCGRVAAFCTQAPPIRVNRPTDTASVAEIAPPAVRVRPPAGAVIALLSAIASVAWRVRVAPLLHDSGA